MDENLQIALTDQDRQPMAIHNYSNHFYLYMLDIEEKDKMENEKIYKNEIHIEDKDKVNPVKMLSNCSILKEFQALCLTVNDFFNVIRKYILIPETLFNLGFPQEFVNGVSILNNQFPIDGCVKSCHNRQKLSLQYNPYNIPPGPIFERKCARCGTNFLTTNTHYLTMEPCIYHYGKLKMQNNNRHVFTCCRGPEHSIGCTVGHLHVWNGLVDGVNDHLEGFVKIPSKMNQCVKPEIYALDCEMCYTIRGLELCKVTVVGIDGRVIYESFVRPDFRVVDFNTRFSGVTGRHITKNSKTLHEVQQDFLNFINDETILVGHTLHNDLRALKIVHKRLIDTSLIFPHEKGLPYRYSLKELTRRCLKKEIQCSPYGHDSYEDAVSSMELLLWKIVQDFRVSRQVPLILK